MYIPLLLIQSPMHGYFASFWILWVMLLWTFTIKFLLEHVFFKGSTATSEKAGHMRLCVHAGTLDGIPWVFEDLLVVHFPPPPPKLANLNWPIFSFTKSFFCLLQSTVDHLRWIYSIIFFNSLISFCLFFIISISLLIFSIWWGIILRLLVL